MSTANQFSFGWRSLSTRHSEKREFLSVAKVTVEFHATNVGDNADSDNKVLSSIQFKLQETDRLNLVLSNPLLPWTCGMSANVKPATAATSCNHPAKKYKEQYERKRTDELVAHANNGTTNLFFNEIEKQWSLALIIKKHQLFSVFQ